LKTTNGDHLVYVTYSRGALDSTNVQPAYYTVIDPSLVLLYEGSEQFMELANIRAELNAVVQEQSITLVGTEYLMLEHNPIWQAFLCGK